MKTLLLFTIALLCLVPMTFAQTTCPEQAYLPLTGQVVAIDPNLVAYDFNDPNDPNYPIRKQLLLNVIPVVVGKTVSYEGYSCDPDGEPISMSCENGSLSILSMDGNVAQTIPSGQWGNLLSGGRYRWQWTPTTIGVTYHYVEAKDIRPGTNDSRSIRGTLVVVAIPKNEHAPRLCGGTPSGG